MRISDLPKEYRADNPYGYYKLENDLSKGYPRTCYALSREVAEILYKAYSTKFGTSQSFDRLFYRGGFGISEIHYFREQGLLDKSFTFLDKSIKIT